MPTHLVQISDGATTRVAMVDEPHLRCLEKFATVYELAHYCVQENTSMEEQVRAHATGETLPYDDVYSGVSKWRLLAPIHVPGEPSRLLISGTGLTHLGSARQRQAMHIADPVKKADEPVTDSMRMFQWGLKEGRPPEGAVGVAPEWFYKGNGSDLRGPQEALEIPSHAEDGGEEAEIAGVYIVGANGEPYRIGFAQGNEFSDHKFEKRNYLNLAGSKLRTCALGPELVVDPEFQSVPVAVTIEREGSAFWTGAFRSGESEMCHSLQNIEHHHFKYEAHRRRGDVHVHFFGTDCLSFGDHIRLQDGDVIEIAVEGYGRPLRNPVRTDKSKPALMNVTPLG